MKSKYEEELIGFLLEKTKRNASDILASLTLLDRIVDNIENVLEREKKILKRIEKEIGKIVVT